MYRAVVFGAGSRIWEKSALRLRSELLKSDQISRVDLYTADKLEVELPGFWKAHGDFVTANKRGFGYWLWKPYILMNSLEGLDPTEQGVLYIDAGCSINVKSLAARLRFQQYVDLSNKSGGLFFRLIGENTHRLYTKRKVINLLHAEQIESSNLIAATTFFLSNSLKARIFLEKWAELMTMDEYHNLVDPEPDESQHTDFVAHRHDQSLMSIALRDFDFIDLEDETYFSPYWKSQGSDFPIWATRIRSRMPFVSEGLFMKLARRLERTLSQ